MTCIGNSGPLPEEVSTAIEKVSNDFDISRDESVFCFIYLI